MIENESSALELIVRFAYIWLDNVYYLHDNLLAQLRE